MEGHPVGGCPARRRGGPGSPGHDGRRSLRGLSTARFYPGASRGFGAADGQPGVHPGFCIRQCRLGGRDLLWPGRTRGETASVHRPHRDRGFLYRFATDPGEPPGRPPGSRRGHRGLDPCRHQAQRDSQPGRPSVDRALLHRRGARPTPGWHCPDRIGHLPDLPVPPAPHHRCSRGVHAVALQRPGFHGPSRGSL